MPTLERITGRTVVFDDGTCREIPETLRVGERPDGSWTLLHARSEKGLMVRPGLAAEHVDKALRFLALQEIKCRLADGLAEEEFPGLAESIAWPVDEVIQTVERIREKQRG